MARTRNDKGRKLQRQVRADGRNAMSEPYPCDHAHVDVEQAKICPKRVRFEGNY